MLILLSFTAQAGKSTHSHGVAGLDEPPRVMAALQQGYAAERGIGIRRNPSLAIALYCDAGTMGSPEGFYRIGRILKNRNRSKANAYFALAARLGHREAVKQHDARVSNADIAGGCGSYYAWMEGSHFDLDGFIASMSAKKRKIAAIVRSMAPKYGVDSGFALGIALAESNLEPGAVSPKKCTRRNAIDPGNAGALRDQKRFRPTSKHSWRTHLSALATQTLRRKPYDGCCCLQCWRRRGGQISRYAAVCRNAAIRS